MRAEYINPFIKSLTNAFATMLQCKARRGELFLREHGSPSHPVSGVIGLSGNAVGTVVLNLSEAVALKAASTLLMADFNSVNDDVVDAVGDLANVVAGAAKAELKEFNLSVSLPNVVIGANHEIRFPSNVVPICVPFDTDWGPLRLEVGLAPVTEPAFA